MLLAALALSLAADTVGTVLTGLPGFALPRPSTRAVGSAPLGRSVVPSAAACASLCAAHDRPRCISFNAISSDDSRVVCELNGLSDAYGLRPHPNATYYFRGFLADDAPARQAVPWRLRPAVAVSLLPGLFDTVAARNVEYLLRNYRSDDVLYWFRHRARQPQPPGAQPRGWDGLPGTPDYPYGLKGSIAGLFLMGGASTLRFRHSPELRARVTAVVDGIKRCAAPDGYLMAFDRDALPYAEHPDYVSAWLTHGLLAAHAAGHPDALPMLRAHYDYFNYCEFLPLFLPPQGGPGTAGYRGSAYPTATQTEPTVVHGHRLYLIYQGMIKHTRLALTAVGTRRDVAVVGELYQEDWWLRELLDGKPEAIWQRHWYPHNYEVTAFEAYLDMYVLTGNRTYLDAVQNAWRLFREHWVHVGGSMAINEAQMAAPANGSVDPTWNTTISYPPGSYYLCAGSNSPPPDWAGSAEGPQECGGMNTGELCGSMFWLLLNQRFHFLDPDNEAYVAEMERSLYNVGFANQVPDGPRIRYFARLHGYKQPGYAIGTCCEGQGTRMYGMLPEFIYSSAPPTAAGTVLGVYVDLFAASTFGFNTSGDAQVVLTQRTRFPYDGKVTLTMSVSRAPTAAFALYVRSPGWLDAPCLDVALNNVRAQCIVRGSYGRFARQWAHGDALTFELSPRLTAHEYRGLSQIRGQARFAYMYGPILLAATGQEGAWEYFPPSSPFSNQHCIKIRGVDATAPQLWLDRVRNAGNGSAGETLRFRVEGRPDVVFLSYFEVNRERFTVYPIVARAPGPDPWQGQPPRGRRWTDDPPQPRAQWSAGLASPSKEIDPRLVPRVPDDSLLQHTPDWHVAQRADYSFAVAVGGCTLPGCNPVVAARAYFTEYNRKALKFFDVNTDGDAAGPTRARAREWPVKSEFYGRSGYYGIAADHNGSVYVGVDGGAGGGAILRLHRDGTEHFVVEGVRGLRQLTYAYAAPDAPAGALYFVEEAGGVSKWEPGRDAVTPVLRGRALPQGVAVAASGDVYFSEYGAMAPPVADAAQNGTLEGVARRPGAVFVLRRGARDPTRLATGLWRCRGLALDEAGGVLYVATEANAWDQGSSGALYTVRLADGALARVVTGLDYPQFGAVAGAGADLRVYVPLARDGLLLAYRPRPTAAQAFRAVAALPVPGNGSLVVEAAAQGGSWAARFLPRPPDALPRPHASAGRPAAASPSPAPSLVLQVTLPGGRVLSGAFNFSSPTTPAAHIWLRLPADALPALYKRELPYGDFSSPVPGRFEQPHVSCACVGGAAACACDVVSRSTLHRHAGARWPMLLLNAGGDRRYAGRLWPAEGFDESPQAHLVYLEVVAHCGHALPDLDGRR